MIERLKFSEKEQREILKNVSIIVDSREQVNQHITDYFDKFKIPYEERALDFGDYSFFLPPNEILGTDRELSFEKEIVIERKNSADELAQSLTKNRERLKDEFIKGTKAKKYLVIENCQYQDIVNGNYSAKYNSKAFLGSIHSFDHEYDLRTVFMPDKHYTPIFIYGTFQYYLRNLIK